MMDISILKSQAAQSLEQSIKPDLSDRQATERFSSLLEDRARAEEGRGEQLQRSEKPDVSRQDRKRIHDSHDERVSDRKNHTRPHLNDNLEPKEKNRPVPENPDRDQHAKTEKSAGQDNKTHSEKTEDPITNTVPQAENDKLDGEETNTGEPFSGVISGQTTAQDVAAVELPSRSGLQAISSIEEGAAGNLKGAAPTDVDGLPNLANAPTPGQDQKPSSVPTGLTPDQAALAPKVQPGVQNADLAGTHNPELSTDDGLPRPQIVTTEDITKIVKDTTAGTLETAAVDNTKRAQGNVGNIGEAVKQRPAQITTAPTKSPILAGASQTQTEIATENAALAQTEPAPAKDLLAEDKRVLGLKPSDNPDINTHKDGENFKPSSNVKPDLSAHANLAAIKSPPTGKVGQPIPTPALTTAITDTAGSDPVLRNETSISTLVQTGQRVANTPVQLSQHTSPAQSLAVHIARHAQGGNNRFQIRMDPPELGRVDVRLDVSRDGVVNTHLIVERSETLDLLQRDARQLQKALADAGLQTEGGNLSFSLKDQNAGGNRFAPGNQDQNFHGKPTDNPSAEQSPESDPAAAALAEQQYQKLYATSEVDIRV